MRGDEASSSDTVAGIATHSSAGPHTHVIGADVEQRDFLIEDAPGTYYLTDYYRHYPLVLVRLKVVTQEALRELLKIRLRQPRRSSNTLSFF